MVGGRSAMPVGDVHEEADDVKSDSTGECRGSRMDHLVHSGWLHHAGGVLLHWLSAMSVCGRGRRRLRNGRGVKPKAECWQERCRARTKEHMRGHSKNRMRWPRACFQPCEA